MQTYELTQLISRRRDSNKPYLEFLKVPDLSMGLYILPAGGTDPQSPHTEDEVYYVVSGKGRYIVDGTIREVGPGDAMLTRPGSTHSLMQAGDEDLVILLAYPKAAD